MAGEGNGFEGTLGVTLVSSSDGSVLASSFAAAGNNGEMAPFTANLEVSGAERGWIVVASEGGADNVLAAFSAIPISFVVGGNPIEYVVANIPADDVAGGLHVRDLPGTEDSQVLVTLPAGTAGIQRLGRIPAVVGDQVWWEITVDLEGQTHRGWVNSRFLTDPAAAEPADEAAAMPTDDELAAMAKIFLIAGSDRDVSALGQLRWSEQVEVGWIGRPGVFTSDVIRSDEFWTGPQEWNMPAELGEPQVLLSLLSLLELPDPTAPDVAFEADADPISPYGADQAALGDRFDDARTITIFDQTPDTPWRHTTLVVRPTADGAEIVAVLLTVWVP